MPFRAIFYQPRSHLLASCSVQEPPLFDCELAYPVSQPADAEELQWEVTDYEPSGGQRVLRVTLKKETPDIVLIWWERAFVGEEPIDTLTLPDRRHAAKATAQQDVWKEAQRLFREKVAARQPQVIDVGGGEGMDESEPADHERVVGDAMMG